MQDEQQDLPFEAPEVDLGLQQAVAGPAPNTPQEPPDVQEAPGQPPPDVMLYLISLSLSVTTAKALHLMLAQQAGQITTETHHDKWKAASIDVLHELYSKLGRVENFLVTGNPENLKAHPPGARGVPTPDDSGAAS